MSDLQSLLETLKDYRRGFAEDLDPMDSDNTKRLGEVHLAVLAVEAAMAEPPGEKTGPHIEFDASGWPK